MMKLAHLFKACAVVLAVIGLMVASMAAAPPKPGTKPGPKPSWKVGPKKPVVKPSKKLPSRRISKGRVKSDVRVRIAPQITIPVYKRRAAVRRVMPQVTVTTPKDLAVVPTIHRSDEEAYKVVSIDDDYIVTVMMDGKNVAVRMAGVEPPLVAAAEGEAGELPEPAGHFARNLLVGEFVYLDHDPGLAERDDAGNRVAYLYRVPDRLLVNLELIRQGYGLLAEDYSFQHEHSFAAYQQKAQADRKGIWGFLPTAAGESSN